MIQENFKKWNRISGRLSYVPSQPAAIPSSRSVQSATDACPSLDTWNTSAQQALNQLPDFAQAKRRSVCMDRGTTSLGV